MTTLDFAPPQAIARLRFVLNCSNRDLARWLAVSPRTLMRREVETAPPRQVARERLSTLVALGARLLETFISPGAVHVWLQTSSRYLGGATPIDIIRAGQFDRIDGAREALDSGIFI
jgi:uncharacterized protein (DUF2384 family)